MRLVCLFSFSSRDESSVERCAVGQSPAAWGAAARSDLHKRLSFPQGTFSETSQTNPALSGLQPPAYQWVNLCRSGLCKALSPLLPLSPAVAVEPQ